MLASTHFIILFHRFCKPKLRLSTSLAVSILFHWLVFLSWGNGFDGNRHSVNLSEAKQQVLRATLGSSGAEQATAIAASQEADQEASFAVNESNTKAEPSIASQPTDRKEKVATRSTATEAASERPESKEISGPQFPVFEQAFAPIYPVRALMKAIRGSVTASFRVGKDGTPIDVEIIGGTGSAEFDNAVIQALGNTRIKPGSVRAHSLMIVTVIFDSSGTSVEGSFSQNP